MEYTSARTPAPLYFSASCRQCLLRAVSHTCCISTCGWRGGFSFCSMYAHTYCMHSSIRVTLRGRKACLCDVVRGCETRPMSAHTHTHLSANVCIGRAVEKTTTRVQQRACQVHVCVFKADHQPLATKVAAAEKLSPNAGGAQGHKIRRRSQVGQGNE